MAEGGAGRGGWRMGGVEEQWGPDCWVGGWCGKLGTRCVRLWNASWRTAHATRSHATTPCAEGCLAAPVVGCVQEAGQEPPAAPEGPSPEQVEAEVAAAAAAVAKPEPAEVTDADVLSALMEQGVVSKDAIVQGLAAQVLKEEEEQQQEQQ